MIDYSLVVTMLHGSKLLENLVISLLNLVTFVRNMHWLDEQQRRGRQLLLAWTPLQWPACHVSLI